MQNTPGGTGSGIGATSGGGNGSACATAGASSGGIFAESGSTPVTVDHCEISGNAVGLGSISTAVMRVSNTAIVNNNTGLYVFDGGSLLSLVGDNTYPVKTNVVENNATPGAFTGTFTAQ